MERSAGLVAGLAHEQRAKATKGRSLRKFIYVIEVRGSEKS